MRFAVLSIALGISCCLNAGEASPTLPPAPALPLSATPSPITRPALNSKIAETPDKDDSADDMTAPTKYDEVVRDLIDQLMNKRAAPKKKDVVRSKIKKDDSERESLQEKEQFTVNAQDAARKLASLGKRAVDDLRILFKANYNRPAKEPNSERAAQVAYYAAWALARIRTFEAARVLLPLMTNADAPLDLRLMAVEAAGWEKNEEGVAILEKVATTDSNIEMRKRALAQLAMIPEYWLRSERIFVNALSDPNEEIRVQAAKACHYSHMFASANGKLIELLENDPCATVRLYAMLTVARLRVVKAEPALVRVLQQTGGDEKLRKQAFTAIVGISDIPFRNVESVISWWEKKGRTDFDEYAENEKRSQERLKNPSQSFPIKTAPKLHPLETDTHAAAAPELAAEIIDADIVPLEKTTEEKAAPIVDSPPPEAVAAPIVLVKHMVRSEPVVENLSSTESSGSQRRRLKKE